jgi:hypothetical protein
MVPDEVILLKGGESGTVKISTEEFNVATEHHLEPSMAVLECKAVHQSHRVE